MSAKNFEEGAVRTFRPTELTEGLGIHGEVKGMHIMQAFGNLDNPTTLNIALAEIFSATNRYNGKPLVGMTEAKGKIKTIDSSGFRWTLSGGNVQHPRITEVVCNDSRPGLNNQPFDVIISKPFWNVSDIVIPPNQYAQCRVLPHGTSQSRQNRYVGPNKYRYTLQYVTDNPKEYLDKKYIQEGQEWARVGSAVAPEDNIDGGGFQFYSVFESEGQVGQHAVQWGLNDAACRKINQARNKNDLSLAKGYTEMLWVKYKDKLTGKPMPKFMAVLEAEAYNTLYNDCEFHMMFGKKTSTMYSPEGHQILTSSGLREQMLSGWNYEHNGLLDLEDFEDWVTSVLKDKVPESDQKLVLAAGNQFRRMFDKAIKLEAKTYTTIDSMYIRKGSDFRHMDFGSYFTSYKGFTVDITVMENPAYDNQQFCREMHPVRTNVPIESWSADILDFGSTGAQDNLGTTDNICMIEESFLNYDIKYKGKCYAHDGMTGAPITDGGYGLAGGISGFSCHIEKSAGLMVADPTRCGRIYLSV